MNLLRSSLRPTIAAATLTFGGYSLSHNEPSPMMKVGEGYKRPDDPARTVKDFNEQWQAWAYAKSTELDPVLAATLAKYEGSGWSRVDDVSVKRMGNANHMRGQAIKDSLAIRAGALPAYRT